MDIERIKENTQNWFEQVILEHKFCPFALQPYKNNAIRWQISPAETVEGLLTDLKAELDYLYACDAEALETTLLIHPQVLLDFHDYNQFLALCDDLLEALDYSGIFQVASFHPDYLFAGSGEQDIENYTNRSPYPMLHLLREASVAHAIDQHPDIDAIPERNVDYLQALPEAQQQLIKTLSQKDEV